ncbi:IclR family transcriptional regulator [Rhodococcus sp. KBS0724]|uniref:IclR family transcriptional regulator n=1 Tax=Rhodococcus sp. KBS0724 TaxID=1179674 RepID=UPI00110D5B2F|nr:IclR family transcriptional regulator [Rhodococcus sp. KBS0724]TSD40368.1 IclR family transcriptional regulator [Rhodococcus sp. KBS0724]
MTSKYDTSAAKAFAILDAFAGPQYSLGVSELALITNLPKSTVHRLLAVLLGSRYVLRSGDKYRLSDRAFELGQRAPLCRPDELRDRAHPYMTELFASTRQTIHLAVLAGTDILYLEKLYGHDSVKLPSRVGQRRPAYTTALGKAIVAFAAPEQIKQNLAVKYLRYTAYTVTNSSSMSRSLSRVRQEGYATDFEESYVGVTCLAVPIFDPRTNKAVAALSMSTTVGGLSVLKFRALITNAARQLSTQLEAKS